MKRALSIIGLVLSATASADVPYTFSPNTPAKASEVNQNFEALDGSVSAAVNQAEANRVSQESAASRIAELESKINCPNNNNMSGAAHQFTYEHIPSELGHEIDLRSIQEDRGQGYKIVQVPFVEFSSGEVYVVKFPAPIGYTTYLDPSTGDTVTTVSEPSGTLFTRHVASGTACSDFNISTFPVFKEELEEFRGVSYRTSSSNGDGFAGSSVWFSYSFSIAVGETSLDFSYTLFVDEGSTLGGTDDYDFTNDIDTSKMTHQDVLVSTMDELVDYIQISKID